MALNKIEEHMLGFQNGFNSEKWTAAEGQTVFTLTNGSYKINKKRIDVYIHGIKQASDAFTETSETSFTLISGVPAGTEVEAKWYESVLPATGGHGQQHKVGGVDEISVTELAGYQVEVKDKIDDHTTQLSTTATQIGDLVSTGYSDISSGLNDHTSQLAETMKVVNIKSFGAHSITEAGYENHDSSTSIQNAIDDLNANGGGVLYIPKGTYLAHNITVYSNIRIKGLDSGSTIVRRPATAETNIANATDIFSSKNKTLENVTIEGITLDGNYQNLGYVVNGVKTGDCQEIDFDTGVSNFSYNIKNITVRDCKFINGNNVCVRVRGAYNAGEICNNVNIVMVRDCLFENIYGNAIFIWGRDVTVTNNQFYNIDDTPIGVDLSINSIITDNIVKYDINHTGFKNFDGILGIAASFFSQSDSIVKGNHVTDYKTAIQVDPVNVTSNMAAKLSMISNNIVSSPNRSGSDGLIKILGGKKIKVSGNIVNGYNNYGFGISVQPNAEPTPANSSDITIENNYIYDTKRAGIYCHTVTDLFITANKLTDCGKNGQTFPVDSIYTNNCTDLFVESNKVKNSGRDSIFIESCTNGHINNNYTTNLISLWSGNTNIVRGVNFVNNISSQRSGLIKLNGDASTTVFNIPHGLGASPSRVLVSAAHANSRGDYNVGYDSTNIIVTFATAPISGTENVRFFWDAKV